MINLLKFLSAMADQANKANENIDSPQRVQIPRGEDTVVEAESALLRKQGHDVQIYKRSNHEIDSISRAGAAASTLWSQRTVEDMNKVCKAFRPDIVHAHNTFHLVSPSVYWAAGDNKVPVIQTLHNFRLLCPQAMFLRNGKVCEKCVGRMPWPAVAHQCYRGSVLQSAVTLTMLSGHRILGTYRNKVNLYIALNESGRDKFIRGGLANACRSAFKRRLALVQA
jgi:hypothetical protein